MNIYEQQVVDLLNKLKPLLENAIAYSCYKLGVDSMICIEEDNEQTLYYSDDGYMREMSMNNLLTFISIGGFPSGQWRRFPTSSNSFIAEEEALDEDVLFTTFDICNKREYMSFADRLIELLFDSNHRGFEITEKTQYIYIQCMIELLSPLCSIQWYCQEECQKASSELLKAYFKALDLSVEAYIKNENN